MTSGDAPGPHDDVLVAATGAPLSRAKAAVVLLHGRGASGGDMLSLAEIFAEPDLAYLAPQAAGRSWYPYSFLAPIARNEPFLSSALHLVDILLGRLGTEGYRPERVVLLGFSQGACLALEYAARNARHYGGLVGLSGHLIGPDDTPRDYAGSLADTPVFLGCSDADPHIPLNRVHETARVLGAIDGAITERIYPGMGHTINDAEIGHVSSLLAKFATPGGPDGPDPSTTPRGMRMAEIEPRQRHT
jgi:phospholipase/carboxylesterase